MDIKVAVDKDILAFMQLVQAQDLQKIWDSNGVEINVTTVEDLSDVDVEFLPKHSASAAFRPNEAKDQFQQIYTRAKDSACLKVDDLRGSPSDQKVEEALKMTRMYYKKVHVTRLFEDKHQVLFIAETKQACDAALEYFCRILGG